MSSRPKAAALAAGDCSLSAAGCHDAHGRDEVTTGKQAPISLPFDYCSPCISSFLFKSINLAAGDASHRAPHLASDYSLSVCVDLLPSTSWYPHPSLPFRSFLFNTRVVRRSDHVYPDTYSRHDRILHGTT
jgi:hypothetical protein